MIDMTTEPQSDPIPDELAEAERLRQKVEVRELRRVPAPP